MQIRTAQYNAKRTAPDRRVFIATALTFVKLDGKVKGALGCRL